jgi:long-chain acyl-CoA synthetase
LDADGFLYITGRKKELIVTSGGKNVAPVLLETLLNEDALVYQSMVLGDGRKCLAALIVPEADALRAEIIARGIPVTSKEQALQHEAVRKLYASVIRKRLESLSHYEQVAYFMLLPRAFSIDEGELTPKLSLRRDVIQQHFAAEVAAMYQEEQS